MGIPWPVDTMGVSAGSHATSSQKDRLGKGGKPMTRFQGPTRGQNTNDEDDADDDNDDDDDDNDVGRG